MNALFAVKYSFLIPLLPLLGAMVSGLFGARLLKGASHWPIWIGVGASAVLCFSVLLGNPTARGMLAQWRDLENAPRPVSPQALAASRDWYTWIEAGTTHPQPGQTGQFTATAGAWIDPLTAVMLCVVTGIGLFITIYAAAYMKGDDGYYRFFAFVGLFIFAMCILVMANNFILLYLGWEGVGLCSYLLIGYYYQRPSAREAAKKAFLVNRVGDFAFALGIMLTFYIFGSVSFFGEHGILEPRVLGSLPAAKAALVKWIPLLLMIGAFGKSAQFPLHVWLPDAMEGPTPVSALIHAATMVTAGVYMIVRCGPLFVSSAAASGIVAFVGAFTALFAATIAMRQFDLKKVLAYSTISQLGYMFVGVAALAPVAGIFHLVTHAFFKALLFLAAGVVMHAMAGELDMRKLSGLKRVLPWTRWMMLIGCLALAGCPFFSGFFSKDEIIGAAWAQNRTLGLVMLLAAFLTAYYAFRLYFRVFEGPQVLPVALQASDNLTHHDSGGASHPQAASLLDAAVPHALHQTHGHEPRLMIFPLVVLAIGAVLAGYLNWPARVQDLGGFLGQSPSLRYSYDLAVQYGRGQEAGGKVAPEPFGQEATDDDSRVWQFTWIMGISALVSLSGIGLAYLMHLKDRSSAARMAGRFPTLTRLLDAKYWVDEVYQAGIIEPLRKVGSFFYGIDRIFIDGLIWVIGFVVPESAGTALRLTTQRGYLQGYAATMLFGLVIIMVILFW